MGSNCRIIVFEKEEKNIFAPSLLWLMVGKRKTKDVYRSTKQVTRKGIELVLGNIEKVDPENKSVQVNGAAYKGDYLIISLGAAQQAIPSLSENGFDFFSLDGASGFYDALQQFKGGKMPCLFLHFLSNVRLLHMKLPCLLKAVIRKKGIRDKTEISIYTPETVPMPVAGKALADSVKQMLETKGIKYFPEHQFTQADTGSLNFLNGNSFSFDLLAYTPKHICPDVITNGALQENQAGSKQTAIQWKHNFPNVYAIGDITFIPLELGKPLPKAGVFAHYQAEVVANNIAEKIKGGSKSEKALMDRVNVFLKWEMVKQVMQVVIFMVHHFHL